jgi:hypothetical protein
MIRSGPQRYGSFRIYKLLIETIPQDQLGTAVFAEEKVGHIFSGVCLDFVQGIVHEIQINLHDIQVILQQVQIIYMKNGEIAGIKGAVLSELLEIQVINILIQVQAVEFENKLRFDRWPQVSAFHNYWFSNQYSEGFFLFAR